MYAAQGLPDGLSINPSTGVISGVVTTAAAEQRCTIPQSSRRTATIRRRFTSPGGHWLASVTNYISVNDSGLRNSREGDSGYFGLYASSTLNLPLTYTVTGLPTGLSLVESDGSYFVNGNIAAGASSASPYHVEIVATDGMWSDTLQFDWIVRPSGTVEVADYQTSTSFVNQEIDFPGVGYKLAQRSANVQCHRIAAQSFHSSPIGSN